MILDLGVSAVQRDEKSLRRRIRSKEGSLVKSRGITSRRAWIVDDCITFDVNRERIERSSFFSIAVDKG